MEKMNMIVPLSRFKSSFTLNEPMEITPNGQLHQMSSTSNLHSNVKCKKPIQIPVRPVYFQTAITNQLGYLQSNQFLTNLNMKCNSGQKCQPKQIMSNNMYDCCSNSLVFCQSGKKNGKKIIIPDQMNMFPQFYYPLYDFAMRNESKMSKDIPSESLEDIADSRHRKFSEREDEMLKNIVSMFGPKNWRLISSLIPGRTPRQCRDRYSNYLAPGFIHSDWSEQEDKLLAEKFTLLGPKWAQIRQFFPYRTANDIKNRYNYSVSRKNHLFKNGNSQLAKNQNGESEKDGNDSYFNEDNFDINQQFYLYNDELQANEFEFIDNEL